MNSLFYKQIFSMIFVSCLLTLSHAKDLSLDEAKAIALKNNPSLLQIQARYQALSKIPSQVASLPDPTVSIGAMNYPTNTFNRGQEAMTNIQIGFSQAFPFPGKLKLRKKAAQFEARAAFHSIEELRLDLIQNIVKTWWQIYYFDQALETIEQNQNLLRQFIEIASTKYATGKGLQSDVLLSQVELSKLMDQKIQVEALREQQSINLNTLLGDSPDETIHLSDINTALKSLKKRELLYAMAKKQRPLLHFRQDKILATTARLDLAKKDYYPDFRLSAAYSDRIGYNPSNSARADLMSIQLGVTVPLYYKTKQSQVIAQKKIEQQESYFARDDSALKVLADIAKNVTDYQQAKEQSHLYEAGILPQAKLTVASMLSAYQVSKVDFLNLLQSQVTLFNYELFYWKTVAQAKQALAKIEASVGVEDIYQEEIDYE